MTNILLPELGEGISNAEIRDVIVQAGQEIKKDDVILILETDKASMEIPSDESGFVSEVFVNPGDKISPGDKILTISQNNVLNQNQSNGKIEESVKEPLNDSDHTDLDKSKSSSDIEMSMEETALNSLKKMCLEDLSNGGRGIRNKLEAHLINPVSRELFDRDIKASTKVVITDLKSGPVTNLEMRIE